MVSEKLGAAFIEVGVDTGKLTTGLAGAKAQVTGFGASASSAFSDLAASINPATIAIAGATAGIMAVGAAFVGSVRAAAQWQTLMVDVQKVTDTTAAGFASLSKDLLAIRGETGASMESIAGAAAGAGRMGIDPTEIADYTETILKMSSAWGMSADAASESIGKIGSVVKPAEMTWTEFGNRMGSTINDLADSMATSEESIVTGMKKVSAQMAMLKPSPDQLSEWAALIGQLQAFGMTAETSGESLKDALNYMMRDDKSGISSMLDMDATEFQEAIREDAIGTVQELAVAISELPIEEQGQALQKFGATGGQMMGMLVGKVDPVTKEIEGLNAALATGAGAWENASSLNEAYAKSQEILNAQIEIFKGKISVAAASIGAVLLPVLTDMMRDINGITQALMDLGAKGWKWLYGGVDDEGAETKGAIGRLTGWLDEKLGIEYGAKLGEEMAGEIEPAVTGAVEDGLEEADGTAAGRKVGQEFTDEFKKSLDSMHAAGMRAVYEGGQIVGYESRSTDHKYQYGETFEAGGSTVGLRYEKGGQIPWLLTIGDWVGAFDSPEQAREYISRHFLALDSLISPEQWEIAMKTARRKTTGTYDDPGDVVRLKAELELAEISPYEVWGSPQHIAAKYAEYAREGIEEPLFNSIYNITRNLEEEGKAGMMQAWETILDPNATESQISAALSLLESSGVFGGWGRDVALQVRDGFAGLVDSIVDEGKYQEYKLEELGTTWGNALKDSMIEVQEKETLLGLVDALEDAGYEGAGALRQAILDEDWEGLGALIGDRTGDAMEKTLFGRELRMKDIPALSDLIADPDKLKQTVQNWDQWAENTYQPALQNHIDEASAKWESGYYSQSELNKDYFRDLMTNALQYSDWYEGWQLGLLGAYARGDVGLQEFFDLWENHGKAAMDGASKTEAAVDRTYDAYKHLGECLSTEFSSWRNANQGELFASSYIGSTAGYIEKVTEDLINGRYVHPATEGYVRDLLAAEGIDLDVVIGLDTTEADEELISFGESVASSESEAPIGAYTQPAYNAVDSFITWVGGISASVYVGAYGPGTEYTGGGGYLESLSPGITSSPGWGTPEWLPALAGGGYVDSPTVALIGEAGPEWVVNEEQKNAISGLIMNMRETISDAQYATGRLMGAGYDPNNLLYDEDRLSRVMADMAVKSHHFERIKNYSGTAEEENAILARIRSAWYTEQAKAREEIDSWGSIDPFSIPLAVMRQMRDYAKRGWGDDIRATASWYDTYINLRKDARLMDAIGDMGGNYNSILEKIKGAGAPLQSWLPVLDSGGIVTGPTIAHLAENNRPEAIIPLDQITKIIGGGGPTYNISVNGGGNAEEIARAIRGAIEDYDREKNRSGAYA